MIASLLLGIALLISAQSKGQEILQVHYNVLQCDSLIAANATNPDFVVLDVRTFSQYYYAHLLGAINRDYFASNFHDLIDALPRNKFYLVHCQSGSRSLNTFNLMAGMDFTKLVDMLGGMYAWNAASLPTTSVFAPLLMAVSDTMQSMDAAAVGVVDTLALTITNRANLNLTFTSKTPLNGTEFSTNFNLSTVVKGAEDYTFSIFYEPLDEIYDTLDFLIESNGGDIIFHIHAGIMAPLEFAITLPAGWSGISSCVVPTVSDVEVIFGPLVEELVILQNFDGVYWPDAGVNSIGDWNGHSGYMIKMETAQQLIFSGTAQSDRTLNLSAGWNYLPVLDFCERNTSDFFNQISENLRIVKEVAGPKVYWPEFGIATLDFVVPGKAYFILVDDDVTVDFPECP
jgi:rhodanese-related sulfurtransferase